MMSKTMLLAVLATVLTIAASARVLRPNVKDYGTVILPGLNYIYYDGENTATILNVTADNVIVSGFLEPQFGESSQEVGPDGSWNISYPLTYPDSFVLAPVQFGFVEKDGNKTEPSIVYADAGANEYTTKVFLKLVHDGIENFGFTNIVDKVALSITSSQDRLAANPEALEGYTAALEGHLRQHLETALNQRDHDDDEGTNSAKLTPAALRRRLQRGLLKNIQLPQTLGF